jgi:hypothetical protein
MIRTPWDRCEYLTVAQERRLAAKFRKHIIELPAGSPFGWLDIDAWAEANHPVPGRTVEEDQCYWDDLCALCMVVSKIFEAEGWLRYQYFSALKDDYLNRMSADGTRDSGEYFRTEKTELEVWE